MPPAYTTTCSSCRSRIASKKLCLTLPAGILLQCLEDDCSDEFIGQRLSLNPHSPVSSLSLGGDLFFSLCYVSVSAYILKRPRTRFFVHCLLDLRLSLALSFHHPSSYCTCCCVQSPVITIVCTTPSFFLFLIPTSSDIASRSTPLHMDHPIEVEDPEPEPKDDEFTDQGITRTSSEPERHSGSEESK